MRTSNLIKRFDPSDDRRLRDVLESLLAQYGDLFHTDDGICRHRLLLYARAECSMGFFGKNSLCRSHYTALLPKAARTRNRVNLISLPGGRPFIRNCFKGVQKYKR